MRRELRGGSKFSCRNIGVSFYAEHSVGSAHREMRERYTPPSWSPCVTVLLRKQSSLSTFQFKRQLFSAFNMPGDVTGIITFASHSNPKWEILYFSFTDEKAEAQRAN